MKLEAEQTTSYQLTLSEEEISSLYRLLRVAEGGVMPGELSRADKKISVDLTNKINETISNPALLAPEKRDYVARIDGPRNQKADE